MIFIARVNATDYAKSTHMLTVPRPKRGAISAGDEIYVWFTEQEAHDGEPKARGLTGRGIVSEVNEGADSSQLDLRLRDYSDLGHPVLTQANIDRRVDTSPGSLESYLAENLLFDDHRRTLPLDPEFEEDLRGRYRRVSDVAR